MHRLSSPIEEIQPRYDVVVIGSGYGGAIAASRLARAGQQVCLIEKGREFIPGEFPDTSSKVLAETQIDTPKAHLGARSSLYDMCMNDHINVFKGCGLGGTSLVNANVSLAADPRAIDHSSWPQAFRDDIGTKLREGAERALEMLKATPYQDDDYPPLEKLQALKDSASVLEGKFYRPPINVNFVDGTNHVGVEQQACTRCGDCLTGCNYSAKNTLMMNYLPDAVNHGAQIFTQIDVRRLERENAGWVIHYQLLDSGREGFKAPTMTIRADLVILAAGSLGSTEILLRSGAAGLPLSKRVGKGFTSNGDFLAFSYNSDREINGVGHGHRPPEGREPVGPTITGVIDSRESGALEDGLIIEEGSLAGGFSDMLPLGLSAAAKLFGKDTDLGDSVQEGLRELESLVQGPYHGAIDNTQTYLVMAHDDAQGEMKLEDDRLRINWPSVGEQPIFTTISERLHEATKPLGGTYVRNPAWSKLTDHNLTTVHPLGGCGMGEDAARGVVNHRGQVFLGQQGDAVYENLYVSDGSVVPRALGVNPLLTISAITERCCALIAEDRAWTINYSLPSEAPPEPPRLHTLGIRFTETMKGFLSTEETSDFEAAFRRGQADDSPFQFILTIISDNLEAMIQQPEHQARAIGTVVAPALSPEPLTVTQGVFQLLIEDPDHPDTRLMKYSMKMTSEQGRSFFFYGFKVVRNDPGPDLWKDTTTLYITVFDGDGTDSPVIGKGILDIKPQDFMIQMTTMQVTYAKDDAERLKAVVDFGNFFNRQLFEVYGGVLAKKNAFNSHPLPRVKRPLRMAAPELHLFQTEDGVTLKLTRYRGGGKGPVILSPGFGTSSLAFSIDTIETNLPEFLYAHGYDVWLLDYRASPELASATTQFTLDDIATKDYPAAVDKVLAETGAGDVQMLVHCVGSMTFIMSMLAGKLEGKIRSAICSQLAFYPLSPPLNEFRAGTRIASVLSALGVDTLTTDFDSSNWLDRLTDAVLNIYPTRGRFKSPTERRIQLLYGEVYKHDNLNAATHAAMQEVFGEANLASFQHIAMLVRKGKILNAEGKDVYLPHVERLAIPITLIHGAQNHLFLPEGSRQTLRTLCARNDATLYQMITYPTYAHMDFFIGENAATDIFPDLVAQLNVFNQPRRHTIAADAGAGGAQ